jgi:hypothetical protein
MVGWFQLGIGIVVLWLVVWFVGTRLSPEKSSESFGDPRVEDPLAPVPSPRRRGPQNRSGAVALAEPDEEDEDSDFRPRNL